LILKQQRVGPGVNDAKGAEIEVSDAQGEVMIAKGLAEKPKGRKRGKSNKLDDDTSSSGLGGNTESGD
jgi:hypothetical protein